MQNVVGFRSFPATSYISEISLYPKRKTCKYLRNCLEVTLVTVCSVSATGSMSSSSVTESKLGVVGTTKTNPIHQKNTKRVVEGNILLLKYYYTTKLLETWLQIKVSARSKISKKVL